MSHSSLRDSAWKETDTSTAEDVCFNVFICFISKIFWTKRLLVFTMQLQFLLPSREDIKDETCSSDNSAVWRQQKKREKNSKNYSPFCSLTNRSWKYLCFCLIVLYHLNEWKEILNNKKKRIIKPSRTSGPHLVQSWSVSSLLLTGRLGSQRSPRCIHWRAVSHSGAEYERSRGTRRNGWVWQVERIMSRAGGARQEQTVQRRKWDQELQLSKEPDDWHWGEAGW